MKRISFLLILSLSLIMGCVSQESPEIQYDYKKKLSDYEAVEACSNANLVNNLLEYDNVISIFTCLQWKIKFPNLYQGIVNSDKNKWNHLFEKFNTFFINVPDTKNRFLNNYKKLDESNSFEFLEDIYNILNESDLYERVSEVFSCIKEEDDPNCLEESYPISKEEILNALSAFNTNQNQLKKLLHIVHSQYETFLRHQERIEPLSRELISSVGFDELRINTIDYLTNSFIKGIDSKDLWFIKYLLTSKDKLTQLPWPYALFKNENFTLEEFMRVIEYPLKDNPYYFQDLRVLAQSYKKGISCTKYNDQGERITIDLGNSVGTFLKNSMDLDYFEFLQKSFDLTIQLKNSYEFCPEIFSLSGEATFFEDGLPVTREHQVNLLQFNDSFNRYLQDEDKFNLFKLLTFVGLNAENINDPLYAIKIGSHDLMLTANESNKFIDMNIPDLFELGFDLTKEMSLEEYTINSSFLMNIINDEKNILAIQTLSKFWQRLKYQDKKDILRLIDAQFKEGNNLASIMLYSIESLSELVEVADDFLPLLFDQSQTAKTYESIEELVFHFSKKELNNDLRRFFSKDHLLGIYKILTGGLPYLGPIKSIIGKLLEFKKSLEDLLTDGIKLTRIAYDLIFRNPDPEKATEYYNCMHELGESSRDFYYLIYNFPESCALFKDKSMGFRYLYYLNTIALDFHEKSQHSDWPGPPMAFEKGEGILDNNGLFSPSMLNSSVANMKVADEILGPSAEIPGKGGISYTLKTLSQHLFEYYIKGSPVIDHVKKIIDIADSFFQSGLESKILRSYLLEKATKDENYSHITDINKNLGGFLIGLGNEINNGKYDEYFDKVYPPQVEELKCQNFHNFNIGNDPCPEKSKIKSTGTEIVKRMLTSLGPEGYRPIDFNIQGLHPDGIHLPLPYPKGATPEHYVFDLKEQVYTYYDLADKSLPINKRSYPYFPKSYDKKYGSYKRQLKEWKKGNTNKVDPQYLQKLTTSERLETIMREFSFDNHNLLVQVANHSAYHRMDNIKLTLEKNELLKGCVNLGACGLTLNREEKRMANNALTMYDAFIEIHTYFAHAENLQVFTTSTVLSSAEDVRKPWAAKYSTGELPVLFTKKQLKGHNAALLSLTAQLAFVSNAGRWMKDRLGRSRQELNNYLRSDEFKILNDNYMNGYPLKATYYAISSILKESIRKQKGQNSTFFEDAIDYIYDLDYQEQRTLENFVGNLLFLNSFIGPVSNKKGLHHFYDEQTEKTYRNNKDFNIILSAPLIIKNWHLFKNSWPRDMKLIEIIKKLNSILNIFKDRLLKKDTTFYRTLNDSFMFINNLLLSNQKDSKKGIEILIDYLSKEDRLYDLISVSESLLDYLDLLTLDQGQRNGHRLIELGQNLLKIGKDTRLDYDALKNYIKLTLDKKLCQQRECSSNPHYDEVATLLHYLNQENRQGIKHIEVLFEVITRSDREDLIKMFDEFLPNLEINN